MNPNESAAQSADTLVLSQQVQMVRAVIATNLNGISHPESLIQPRPAGNCLNWVIGHLLCTYDKVLPLLGEEPVYAGKLQELYDRGTPALSDASPALPLDELLRGLNMASERVQAGLRRLSPARLAEPAPFSPTNNPRETVGTLLATLLFHQAYHAGQTGLLRRLAGKQGAIA